MDELNSEGLKYALTQSSQYLKQFVEEVDFSSLDKRFSKAYLNYLMKLVPQEQSQHLIMQHLKARFPGVAKQISFLENTN